MTPLRCSSGFSAAGLFVHLARRSYSSKAAVASSGAAPPLEFLAPRCPAHPREQLSQPSLQAQTRPKLPTILQHRHCSIRQANTRLFSTTASRLATACITNPVKDDEGRDMMMEITPRAANRLSEIMTKDANPNLALRIQVESGGCHGFQYLMSLITMPSKDVPEGTSIVNEDDSIFQYVREDGDATPVSAEAPRIILDEPSLELLNGSKVDFTMELIGSQFKITDNPHASSSCGCGTSFDIKA